MPSEHLSELSLQGLNLCRRELAAQVRLPIRHLLPQQAVRRVRPQVQLPFAAFHHDIHCM